MGEDGETANPFTCNEGRAGVGQRLPNLTLLLFVILGRKIPNLIVLEAGLSRVMP